MSKLSFVVNVVIVEEQGLSASISNALYLKDKWSPLPLRIISLRMRLPSSLRLLRNI